MAEALGVQHHQWTRLGLAAVAAIMVGCRGTGGQGASPLPNALLDARTTQGGLAAIVASSDLAVGRGQRFILALIGPDNQPISNADVTVGFVRTGGTGTAAVNPSGPAQFRESLPGHGAYVASADFDQPGTWAVVASVAQPGRGRAEVRAQFQVKAKGSTPAVGDRVPASPSLTGSSVSEIEKFSSARPVDPDLYRLSIAEAVTQPKPLAVLFATPGFCTSQLCGPSIQTLGALKARYGEAANFIHVEIYKDASPSEGIVPTVAEWGLPSEPWLFVVGSDGRLVAKFEGIITADEVEPVLQGLIGS